ncbi:MAG: hypothetical protein ABH834_05015 [Candidatus Altiarchaeota archaeon]
MARKTLKQFIKENHYLITVLGVFGALTAIFSQLYPIQEFPYPSFFSIALFLVVAWELWVSFPKSEDATGNLKRFEHLFVFLSLAMIVCVFKTKEYQEITLFLLALALIFIYSTLFSYVLERKWIASRIRRWAPEDSYYGSFVRVILSLSSLYLLIWLLRWSLNLLKNFL